MIFMRNQKGFVHWVILILISVMVVGLVGAAWYYEEKKGEHTTVNTKVNTNTITTDTNSVVNVNTSVNTNTVANETDDWETYTNKANNFKINYPSDWEIVTTQGEIYRTVGFRDSSITPGDEAWAQINIRRLITAPSLTQQ